MKRPRHTLSGPLCPADPAHGPVLSFDGVRDWYCPHSGHDDPKAPTRAWFTTSEVERAA